MGRRPEQFQLQSEIRRQIIENLLIEPLRHTQISLDLKISPAETTRHLTRLVGSNVLRKRSDSTYEATRYGELLYARYKEMEYISENQDFFNKRNLSTIPPELMSMSIISQGEIIRGAMKVSGELFNMITRASIFSWSMSIGPIEPFILENANKLDEGVEMRFIQQRDQRVPLDYMNSGSHNIQLRTLEVVDIGIHMNENKALVILPDSRSEIDYSSAIVGDSHSFLRWASMLFEYYWDDARYVAL